MPSGDTPGPVAFGMLAGAVLGASAGLVQSRATDLDAKFTDVVAGSLTGLVTGAILGYFQARTLK